MEEKTFEVLKAFLCDSWSHRKIQREIMGISAPSRGGGFKAMSLLHEYDVRGRHKGMLDGEEVGIDNILILFGNNKNKSMDIIYPDEANVSGGDLEGARRQVFVNSYERNSSARQKCIEHYGFGCSVCKKSLSEKYGTIGEGFIHVHHLKLLSEIGMEYIVDPINDLRPVCPNCHAMLHQKHPPYTVEELIEIVDSRMDLKYGVD